MLDTPEAATVGRLVRQPDHQIRPVGHPVLHRRPGDAVAAFWPRQHAQPSDHLGPAARQGPDQHGEEHGALRHGAGRPRRRFSRRRTATVSASPSARSNKGAAWEFIKWALSKEMLTRLVKEHGYPSVCRRSVIESEPFKEALTLNGQDVAALYLKVLEQMGGRIGYMRYRTVPVFPQVGDKINRAIEAIATKQMDAGRRAQAGAGAGDRGDQEGAATRSIYEPCRPAAKPRRRRRGEACSRQRRSFPDAVPGAVAGGADGRDAGADGLSGRHQLDAAEPDQPCDRVELPPAACSTIACCCQDQRFQIRSGCRRSCRSGRSACNW